MKKISITMALATLGALPAAHAQSSVDPSSVTPSSVTLYGLMDAGLVQEGGVSKLTSGISAGSRLGLRGTESLGNRLQAITQGLGAAQAQARASRYAAGELADPAFLH